MHQPSTRRVRCLGLVVLAFAGCLSARLDAENPYERHLALLALEPSTRLVGAAEAALLDADWRVAATACTLALQHSRHRVATAAERVLASRRLDDQRVEYLIRLVGELGEKGHAATVAAYLGHARPSVRSEALRALALERLGHAAAERWITPLTLDRDREVRARALAVLNDYPSRSAQITVAHRLKQWRLLADLGASSELLSELRGRSPAARADLLATIQRSSSHHNAALMVSILGDPALVALRPSALAHLERSQQDREAVAEIKSRILEEWRRKLADHEARCATPDWYRSFSAIRAWAERPELPFLTQVLTQSLASCREAALQLIRAEAAR